MTAPLSPAAALASEARLTPDELIAGPGALPVAPMAMPHQQIEHAQGLIRRLLVGLHLSVAPSVGH